MGEFFNGNLLTAFYAGLVCVFAAGIVTGITISFFYRYIQQWKAAHHAR